jgi:hypothetical protein
MYFNVRYSVHIHYNIRVPSTYQLIADNMHFDIEELNGPAVSALGVRSQNLSNVCKGQSSDR